MSVTEPGQHVAHFAPGTNATKGDTSLTATLVLRVLSAIPLLIGIGCIVWTIRLVVQCYTPAWNNDQWDIAAFLIQTHDHPGIRDLWSQHNEHRIIFQRLVSMADMFWFGNAGISLRAEIIVVQFLHLAVFVYACRRWGNFGLSSFAALGGFLAYCFFSPLQMENFDWGFQVTFVLVSLAASATILLMLLCKDQPQGGPRQTVLVAATLACAAVTEMANANGLLIWPILVFLAFVLELSRRKQFVLGVSAVCGTAAYLIGYQSPAYHSNPFESVRHPGAMLKYMLTCFGYSWNASLPNPSAYPTVAESCTALTFLAVIWLVVRCLRYRSRERSLVVFVVADVVFFIGTVGMAAAGRIKFGYGQATVGRYQSFALVVWACAAIGIFLFVSMEGRSTRRAMVYVAMLVLLLGSLSRWHGIRTNEITTKRQWDAGWKAVLSGDLSSPALAYLYPDPGFIRGVYPYLISHGLIENSVRSRQVATTAAGCYGRVDEYTSVPGRKIVVSGWAYDFTRTAPAEQVALVSADGRILGSTGTGVLRPDVLKAIPMLHSKTTGWKGTWPLPPSGTYKAYVVVNGRPQCPLNGSVVIP